MRPPCSSRRNASRVAFTDKPVHLWSCPRLALNVTLLLRLRRWHIANPVSTALPPSKIACRSQDQFMGPRKYGSHLHASLDDGFTATFRALAGGMMEVLG